LAKSYIAGAAGLMALVLSSTALSEPLPACAAALGDASDEIAFASPISDADQVALSASIYRALRGPNGTDHWPRPEIAAAPVCDLRGFDLGANRFVLSGGKGVVPSRWARSATQDLIFFLADGRDGESGFPRRLKRHLFFLISIAGGDHFVLAAYDGAPSEDALVRGIQTAFGPAFVPLASCDPEGQVVDVYRDNSSGIGAKIFGPTPRGDHVATLHNPDGRYFVADPKLDVRMRGSGLACPADLGVVAKVRMFVVEGQDETLDLGCSNATDGVNITIFVTVGDGKSLARHFHEGLDDAHAEDPGAQVTKGLLAGGGRGQFTFGEAWGDEADQNSGLWMGERDGYRIELRVDWTSATAKVARLAAERLQALAFERETLSKHGPAPAP
jgi:hypothetical protein